MQDVLAALDAGANRWIVAVFLVVLATACVNYVLRRVLRRLQRHVAGSAADWNASLVDAATVPLLLASWVLGLSVAAGIIADVTGSALFEYAGLVRRVAIIGLLLLFLVKLIRNVEQALLQRRQANEIETDEITIRVVGRLLRLSVLITGVLVTLQTLGISVSGVVAFGGIGGIAVGFAAKDLLANFFGGLMIYLDRPFTVGDWVRSPDREIEGTVEDIGWRLTRIRTFDQRPLYIPNATFMSIAVENPSRMLNRRIKATFGLRYSDAGRIDAIVADVRTMLEDHPEIDPARTLIVNFDALSASTLDFFIYTFTRTTDWVRFHAIKQDVLLKVIGIVHAHGADLAFPTRTLDGLHPAPTHAA